MLSSTIRSKKAATGSADSVATPTNATPRINFTDADSLSPINYPSTWKKTKPKKDGNSQTIPIDIKDSALQTTTTRTGETQTDPIVEKRQFLEKYNVQSLTSFLQKIEPQVSKQLMQNVRSRALDGYTVRWEDQVDSVSCLHTFEHISREMDTVVTDIAWNKTGSVVGVAYGRHDHENWCSHKGMLCAWNIVLRDLVPEKASFAAETPSCLLSIAFHPNYPNIVAGGTFNGEIIIWDTNNAEDPVIASTTMNDLAHQEPVAKISWVPAERQGSYKLMSVGNDGKVFIWDPSNKLTKPTSGAQIMLTNVPRHALPKTLSKKDVPVGVTALSYSKINPKDFILGTESGLVLKCNMDNLTQLSAGKSDIKFNNLITFAYSPHTGPIHATAYCPTHRNLFLTSSNDGTVRLYSTLQTGNILSWQPSASSTHALYSIEWSPTKPSVFAVSSADGNCYVYDLTRNQHLPVVSLSHSMSTSDTSARATASSPSITAFAFNHSTSRMGYIATGDHKGVVKVWRLSSALTDGAERDTKTLESLAQLTQGD